MMGLPVHLSQNVTKEQLCCTNSRNMKGDAQACLNGTEEQLCFTHRRNVFEQLSHT